MDNHNKDNNINKEFYQSNLDIKTKISLNNNNNNNNSNSQEFFQINQDITTKVPQITILHINLSAILLLHKYKDK